MYDGFNTERGPFFGPVEIGYEHTNQYGKFLSRINRNTSNILAVIESMPTNKYLSSPVTERANFDAIRGINKICPYCIPPGLDINIDT